MQVSSHTAAHATNHAQELAAALQLIAHGTGDDKVRFIAERDPDMFVDQLLNVDYVDRDATTPAAGSINRQLMDQMIARIALRDRTYPAMRHAG